MTYEYVCTACAHEWEAEQPISADPLKDCPKCGQSTAKRQVSGGAGFILKGGGWYADGYGSSQPSKPAEGSDKKSEAKPDKKAETKSDSKPDKKPETKSKKSANAA